VAGRHALLIATESYADPALRRLTAPGGDARALEAVLSDPSIAGFEVTTLIDQPHHVVGEAIGEFYRVRRRDELTLLYFTGHGVKDDDGSLYLAMANTRRDSLMFTALAAELVDRAMAGCPSRQKVLVLDCCYSGAFPAGKLAKAGTDVHTLERFQGRGRAVLTASDATQYSFEGDSVVGSAARSVFTRHLVAGLRDGSADLDGDGDVTVDELYSYVHERVVAEMPRQRPKHQSDVEGRIVLARNPRWTLPEYLSHGLASPIAADRLSALEGLKRLNRVGNEVVRARTAAEIRKLTDDDSRTVSAAAQAWVGAERDAPEAASPMAAPAAAPALPEASAPARMPPGNAPAAASLPRVPTEPASAAAPVVVPVPVQSEPGIPAGQRAVQSKPPAPVQQDPVMPTGQRIARPTPVPVRPDSENSAGQWAAQPKSPVPVQPKPATSAGQWTAQPKPPAPVQPQPATPAWQRTAQPQPPSQPARLLPKSPLPGEDDLDRKVTSRDARFYLGTAGLTLLLLLALIESSIPAWLILLLSAIVASFVGLGLYAVRRHYK
jgi:hypothetical protein